ncbi:MAG: methyltransferase domain-containing protein [Acidobacteriia bacterium]|nr:methyltransferase domain-containing protein [Terriglobia bacterium]
MRGEYDRIADSYDHRWKNYIDLSVQETVDRMQLSPGDRILDLGCGTGTLFEKLGRMHPDVSFTGLDLSLKMLTVAQEKLGAGAGFVGGRVHQLPFADKFFDVVVSCSSFHFWRDPHGALLEIARVTRPGGTVLITDWCDDYLTSRLVDLFLRCFNAGHFHSYRARECQAIFETSGLQDIRIERYKIDWLWGLMTVKAVTASS